MLNNFVLPASVSSGQAVEGVQQIQGFAPYNQLNQLMPSFKLADDGAKPEDEENKKQAYAGEESGEEENLQADLPEIFRLAYNVSFREMIEYFLVPGHDQVLDIRSRIRNEREAEGLTIFAPKGDIPQDFSHIREQLYEFQMQLFSTPKGLHCHIIL
ncbi:MAG: hypothetical protein R6V27_01590 [Balneolaceae bacterium]